MVLPGPDLSSILSFMERETDHHLLEASPAHPLHFDAWLEPHRSLSPRGFLYVMIFIAGVSFAAGFAFLLMGAWPVFGFFGLDVALIYYAFRRNFGDARAHETVQLSDDLLKIRKVDARGGVVAWVLKPYWSRVEIEDAGTDRDDEDDVTVRIRSHGRNLTVAHFLSPAEKREFGTALAAALQTHRQLRYRSGIQQV